MMKSTDLDELEILVQKRTTELTRANEALRAEITERKRAEEALRRRAEELAALQATVLDITAPHDLPTLLQTIVERAARLLNAVGGVLDLCDPDHGEVRCVVSYNTPRDYSGTVLKYGEGASGTVIQTREPLIIDDYRSWSRRAAVFEEQQPFTAILSVPMIWQGQVTGVIHVLGDVESRRFTQADLELLTLFANHAAIAVENTRLYEQAQKEIAERKQAEEALRESERKLRLIAENTTDVIFAYDMERHLIYVNPAVEELTGYSADELRQREFINWLHPEDEARMMKLWEKLFEGQGFSGEEFRIVTKDGQVKWCLSAWGALYDESGRQIGIQGRERDITERKRAEEALRESEERFRLLADNAFEGICIHEKGRILGGNQTQAKMFGYEESEMVGKDILEFAAPESRDLILRNILSENEKPYETVGLRKDGSTFPVEIRGKAIPYHGRMVRVGGLVDITERKRAEEALRKSQQLLEKTFASLRDAVCIIDADTVEIVDCNPAASEIFGYSREEMLGRTAAFLHVDEAELEEFREHLYPAVEEKGFLFLPEFRMKRKDGTVFPTEHSVVPLEDERGKRIGWVGVVRDITERKRAEERVRREAARAAALARVAARLNAQLDLDTVLSAVCAEAAHALNVPTASVTLYEPDREVFIRATSFGLPPEVRECFTPIPRSLYDEYARQMGPLIVVPDVQAVSGLPNVELYARHNFCTTVAASLIREDELVGTLNIYTMGEPRTFDEDELALLKGLADQAAQAIANAQLFKEVQAGRERLQALSHQLVEAEESERRRIARELHDEIGQTLTLVKINLQTMQRLSDAPALAAHLEESISTVERALQQVRTLSLDLRPSLLDDLGLVPALRWYVDRQAQQAGLSMEFAADPLEQRLPPDLEITCFRLVQEALTNVVRHAQAQRVSVELRRRDGELQLVICDDGVGFDVQDALQRAVRGASLGLLGMQERILSVGGQIEFESAPTRGTEIRAHFLPTSLSNR
jgi:PAS domain S-box-containing protein